MHLPTLSAGVDRVDGVFMFDDITVLCCDVGGIRVWCDSSVQW